VIELIPWLEEEMDAKVLFTSIFRVPPEIIVTVLPMAIVEAFTVVPKFIIV
jgi:hypothetical protein